MHFTLFRCRAARWLLAGLIGGLPGLPAHAGESPATPRLSPDSPAVDVGIQPLSYPSGVITAVMHRDRILRGDLAALGQPPAEHSFRHGADILPLLADRRLEAAVLGDMPTILGAAGGRLWIVGLVKQASTAIVAHGAAAAGDLAGKRLAYVPASSAHRTLLEYLSAANLREDDIDLVPMGIDEMSDALQTGRIDAFAAWEPALSTALAADARIVFRGRSSNYFVIDRNFARRSPEAATALLAGLVRAIEWMRLSRPNLEKAARWAIADGAAFSGKPAQTTPGQVAAITRRELLAVPSAPVIVTTARGAPPLKGEFEFLREQRKLPPDSRWEDIAESFRTDLLQRVLARPKAYRLHSFDYKD